VTVTVSVSVSSCNVKSTAVACPRLTVTPDCVCGRKLAMFTVTSYGPPTRTFSSENVPSAPVTPS